MDSVLDGSQKKLKNDFADSAFDAEEEIEDNFDQESEEEKEAQNDEDFSPELDDDDEFLDGDEELDESLSFVTKSSAKEKNAHELEIRRAIEERQEERQMSADLDYLDVDFD